MRSLKSALPVMALMAVAVSSVMQSTAFADDASDNQALKDQMRIMMQRIDELQRQVQELSKQQGKPGVPATSTTVPAAVPATVPGSAAPPSAAPAGRVDGEGPTLAAGPTAAGPLAKETTTEPLFQKFIKGFYGTLDVSIDDATKGMNGFVAYPYSYADPTNPLSGYVRGPAKGGGAGPVGRVGWQPDLSSNKSILGYRGSHLLPGTDWSVIYQIEVQPQITTAPGVSTGYTSQSDVTKGSIGYGDSYLGIANNAWGKLKLGTTYTPYKKSTDRMNPFSGMLGDYGVIMGNTGGDNRVEFGTRVDHSIWYESPVIANVFSFDVLFSPGQNRTPDSLAQSSGSSDCNGGNVPGSGNLPLACDDGGYDNAYSVDIKFESGPIYLTAAYELHKSVNRNSDGVGSNNPYYNYLLGLGDGASPLLNWAAYDAFAAEYPQAAPLGTPEYTNDIANESAFKVGGQFTFDFGLAVSGIYEYMKRDLPAAYEFQNERQRNGLWFALSENFSVKDNLSVGWGHAGASPGDPGGQHNYNPTTHNNTANLYTIAWKHHFDKNTIWYIDAADTVNARNAHYDLGAGGRGVTTDCHDGTTQPFIDYSSAGPTTWGGCHPIGFSTGINYKF